MAKFGRGLCYNLGLLLSHAERIGDPTWIERTNKSNRKDPSRWFNGVKDHLDELEIDLAPESVRDRLRNLMAVVGRGWIKEDLDLDMCEWTIQEAKDILRMIDEAHGVPTEKGDYE